MRPKFLDGYPLLDRLKEWRDTTSDTATGRSWEISSHTSKLVSCKLRYIGEEGVERYTIQHVSPSAEESVYYALLKFAKSQNLTTTSKVN